MLDDEIVEATARTKVDVDRAEDDEEADTIREKSVPRFLDAIVEGIIVEVIKLYLLPNYWPQCIYKST